MVDIINQNNTQFECRAFLNSTRLPYYNNTNSACQPLELL